MTHLAALPPNRAAFAHYLYRFACGAVRPRGRLLTGRPQHSDESLEDLELIPYSLTNLHVAAFPLIAGQLLSQETRCFQQIAPMRLIRIGAIIGLSFVTR